MSTEREHKVLSGMRPSGRLHLGHYHGVLKNWLELQLSNECYFFVADWHAMTTHYDAAIAVPELARTMVTDWLACGIDPGSATLFVQSQVPEHAELHLLLSMITPQGWLERIPSYKDARAKATDEGNEEQLTYGFLGYPLLQAADVLAYRTTLVPVGEDQMAHIEFAREVARRFNYIFGRDSGFVEKAERAIEKLGKKNAGMYRDLRKKYQEDGDAEARDVAVAMLNSQTNLQTSERERLLGFLEGLGRVILPEPQGMLTKTRKFPGLDGRKMSKSYGNTITLRDTPDEIEKKIKTMQTDPARRRRSDPGDPDKCPVWELHHVYSDDGVRKWVNEGCRSAGIGCLECKKPLIDAVQGELGPIRERIEEYDKDAQTIKKIITEGNEVARAAVNDTLQDVRRAMKIAYR